jgi:hypothetical protein
VVRLVEENEFDMMDGPAEPRVVFQIIPAAAALPQPVAGWQRGAAALLLLLTLGSSLQLGLAANVGLLPKETLQWLANPDNLSADALPPGLDGFDPQPFFDSVLGVGGAALLPQLAHELGHRVAAALKGITLAPSFLIPNSQLATFGSITQLKSLARNRADLFDFAAAGLLAGGAASLALFLAGAAASAGGGGAEAGLVPVPAALFQGSLLLGGAAKLALGGDALAKTSVLVSPLLIGGWCGLVCTALNALPVGNLDGGRTMLVSGERGCSGAPSGFAPKIPFCARLLTPFVGTRRPAGRLRQERAGLHLAAELHRAGAGAAGVLAGAALRPLRAHLPARERGERAGPGVRGGRAAAGGGAGAAGVCRVGAGAGRA